MECIVRVLITEAIILDFMLIFQKRHFTEKNLDIGTERLKLPETCLTTQNYYRRNQMSKGKDISTMFTKEENKKMEDLDIRWIPEKKILSLALHNMEHSCRKEVREDE